MKRRLLTIFASWALLVTTALAQSNASYTINLPGSGNGNYYLICNQLDHGSNTLDLVLPNMPDGTQIYTWDCTAQDFSAVTPTYSSLSHHWTPNSILAPGQGAFLVPAGPLASITFTGTPHVPVLPATLPCGFGSPTILSRQTNDIGTYENITGLAPSEGSRVALWDVAAQDYTSYTFSCGVWTPSVPSVPIGAAALITVTAPTAPSINSDTSDHTVCNLDPVSFTVGACGSLPLSYRWQKNAVDLTDGGNISGAHTATLTLAHASTSDAGSYRVIVTNPFGTASGRTATLTVTDCGSVLYEGLVHKPAGQATLDLDAPANELTIGNIGSSGQDGVDIALPPGNNFEGSWLDLDPNDALPVGAYVQSQMLGGAGSVSNGVLGTTRCTKAGTSNYVISVDYSPLGSSNYTVQIYNGSDLVMRLTGQTGAACATVELPPGSCTINPWLNNEWPSPTLITISGGPAVMGTEIVMIPEGAATVSAITTERILAANIPSITMTNESLSVRYRGLRHTALGNATFYVANQLDHGSNTADLIVGNLGSSGQDGVDIALPSNLTGLDVHWQPLDPSNSLPIGAYVREQIIGTNGLLGTVTMTKTGSSNFVISADFSPAGASTYTVRAYRNGIMVAQATNQPGTSLASCNIWGDSGCIPQFPPILGGGWDWTNTPVDIGGGAVLCDHLYITPENVSGAATDFQIVASQVPAINITSENVSMIYDGLTNTSLGSASMIFWGFKVSSNQLVIGNIGSSGQDGVDIAISGNNFAGSWLELDSDGTLPVGAYVQSQMIGTAGTVTNGVLGTTRCTKAGTSNYVITVDYSPLGSSSHTIQVYNDSLLVAQVTGQTASVCATVKLPPGTCTINTDLNSEWKKPTLISINGGPAVTGTGIVMIPEGGATIRSIVAERILAANIPSITITNEDISIIYDGLKHSSLGEAWLIANQLDHGSNTADLVVANLGSSGQDGVSIALPGNLTGLDVHWQPLDPSNSVPIGAYIREQIIGTANGVTNGMLGTVTMTKAGTGNYVVSADFSPIGASTFTVQAYRNGILVAQATNQPGAALASAGVWGDSGCIPQLPILGGGWDWTNTPVDIGAGPFLCDHLYINPENVSGTPTDFQIVASQVPAITITGESQRLTYQGLANTPLGDAWLIANQLDHGSNTLALANLGSSGQDGVSIALLGNGTALDVRWQPLGQSNNLPVGAYLREQIVGTANGITNGRLGTITMTKMGTSNYVVSADFSPIGATHFTVQAYRDGVLVAQAKNQSGAALASAGIWGDSGCIPQPPIFGGGWDWTNTPVLLAGGITALCDHLYILPENVSGTSTAFQLVASQIPILTITSEDSTLAYGGLALSALGDAFINIESNAPPAIANLGSSGQDGVSLALPVNAPGVDVHWQALNPSSAVGAYIQERLIGTANGVTNGILGTITMTKAGASNYVISADFSPLGVSSVVLKAFRNGLLVAQRTNQTSASLASCNIWGDSGCTPLPPIIGGGWDWTNTLLNIVGGPSVLCDHLYIMPQNVSGTPTALQITASQVPSLNLTAITASPLLIRSIPTPAGLTLQWFGTGIPQQSSDLKTWTDIPNAVSPYVVPLGLAKQFYRIAGR